MKRTMLEAGTAAGRGAVERTDAARYLVILYYCVRQTLLFNKISHL